ncbi:MAG: twin-arginine translocation signal domain-containing protein [Deltaproteobacteria bacterium]|nr:twin-arginine translocation signal domain-containing protein [Deltaproteobacteria bacterium]
MKPLSRRQFLKASGLGVAALGAIGAPVFGQAKRRVIVIGGGWGGATAAKYLRLTDPSIDVTLLEPNKEFISCPFSNLVLAGVESLKNLTLDYNGLRKHGVKIRHEAAAAIEPDKRRVRVGKDSLEYDRLIVSPGIDFQWELVDGLAAAKDKVLHAWKAGPQTLQLAKQIQSMADGGVIVMTVPPVAYRCPPGPYERASMIGWYLKTKKPKSKLIVLDANKDIVSKTGLFKAVFKEYMANIDYRPAQRLEKIDVSAKEVTSDTGDKVKYDVVNVIPPQRAGAIAVEADLVGADKRWCEVDHVTYESVKQKNIHVVGDATIGLPVPKSGNVANAMGKISATAVAHLLNGKEPPQLAPGNTCYSWVSDKEAIAVVNAYRIDKGKVVQIEQKLTPGKSAAVAENSLSWRTSIWNDMLG